MSKCPFFSESVWSGNKCGVIDDAIPNDCFSYCQPGWLDDEQLWKKCRIYKASNNNSSGGCFLTSACMTNQKDGFDDECEELTILRHFRDTYVKENHPDSINEYYALAPKIVKTINELANKNDIYNDLYNELVAPCVYLIKNNEFEEAYNLYKAISLNLSKKYA